MKTKNRLSKRLNLGRINDLPLYDSDSYSLGNRCRRQPRAKKPNRILKRFRKQYEVHQKRKARHVPRTATKPTELPPDFKVSETDIIRSICKESFFEFVKEFWDVVIAEVPKINWHIQYLCDQLQKMAERVFRGEPKKYDLVVNISPGTTKSTIISVMFPTWCWTRMPSFRYIGASYSFPLAMDLSRKSRDVVLSEKYKKCFPEIQLREDQNTKGYFANNHGGYRYAVGINGSVMGMHAHFIGIDDPLDPNESVSAADLASANRWIKETLSSRKVDKAVTPTVLVMQRLHQDDPTAQFLAKKNIRWICLPAEMIENEDVAVYPPELKKFYKDGLMDPIRLGRQVLEDAKENGTFYYAAQFLQSPVPPGGGMFHVDAIHEGAPPSFKEFERVARYWDKAGTHGAGAWTVGVLMGKDKYNRFWILDVIRGQWDSYTRERKIEHAAQADGTRVRIGVEQEGGSGGKGSAEDTVARLAGFKVKIFKVNKRTTGGKLDRADPWSVQVNAGNVYVPLGAPWLRYLKEEHKYFPLSKFKDVVDACSGAFAMCHKKRARVGALR